MVIVICDALVDDIMDKCHNWDNNQQRNIKQKVHSKNLLYEARGNNATGCNALDNSSTVSMGRRLVLV